MSGAQLVLCTCVGKVGETVKDGWARHPRRGQSVPRLECRIRMAAGADRSARSDVAASSANRGCFAYSAQFRSSDQSRFPQLGTRR